MPATVDVLGTLPSRTQARSLLGFIADHGEWIRVGSNEEGPIYEMVKREMLERLCITRREGADWWNLEWTWTPIAHPERGPQP